jgi:hypothetical protein
MGALQQDESKAGKDFSGDDGTEGCRSDEKLPVGGG